MRKKKYKVVAVLWDDHEFFTRTQMVKNPDEEILPTLTVGILYKETKKSLVIVSFLERYPQGDDATYWVILKGTIVSVKEFGEIEIAKIK